MTMRETDRTAIMTLLRAEFRLWFSRRAMASGVSCACRLIVSGFVRL